MVDPTAIEWLIGAGKTGTANLTQYVFQQSPDSKLSNAHLARVYNALN